MPSTQAVSTHCFVLCSSWSWSSCSITKIFIGSNCPLTLINDMLTIPRRKWWTTTEIQLYFNTFKPSLFSIFTWAWIMILNIIAKIQHDKLHLVPFRCGSVLHDDGILHSKAGAALVVLSPHCFQCGTFFSHLWTNSIQSNANSDWILFSMKFI